MGHDYFGVFFFNQKKCTEKIAQAKSDKKRENKKKVESISCRTSGRKGQNHYSRREYTLSNFAANLGRDVGDQLAGVGPELDAGQTESVKLEKVTGVGVLKD